LETLGKYFIVEKNNRRVFEFKLKAAIIGQEQPE